MCWGHQTRMCWAARLVHGVQAWAPTCPRHHEGLQKQHKHSSNPRPVCDLYWE